MSEFEPNSVSEPETTVRADAAQHVDTTSGSSESEQLDASHGDVEPAEHWTVCPTAAPLPSAPEGAATPAATPEQVVETPETAQIAPAPAHRANSVSSFLTTVQSLAITVAIAVFVITFIVQAFQIPSESMEDTLLIGDYLLVDKVHYGPNGIWGHIAPYEPIHRGDIIVFKYPVNPTQHFVKRVIGVPGDRVRLVHKRVFVNGQPMTEPYVKYSRPFSEYADNFPVPGMIDPNMEGAWYMEMQKMVDGHELIVPENSYFVLGDNRDKSLDSRFWGFVPRENVVGRPLLIYFSMRKPIEVTTPLSSFSDKLHDLTYNLSDLSGRIRWRRAFRLIK